MKLLATVVALLVASAAGAENPPPETIGWRHNGKGTFPEAHPPTDFSTEKNVLWKTETESWSNASPVIVGNRIFITEEPFNLVCLSADDGKVLWRRKNSYEETFQGEELKDYMAKKDDMAKALKEVETLKDAYFAALTAEKKEPDNADVKKKKEDATEAWRVKREQYAAQYNKFHIATTQRATGYSSPTPVSDGKCIYAYFGNDVVCCYDLDGNKRWAMRAGNTSQLGGHPGRSSSPVIADNKLIVHVDATCLYAFDLQTGKELWKSQVDNEFCPMVSGVIDGLPIVVNGWGGKIIHAKDGSLLGTAKFMNTRVGAPLMIGNLLYAGEIGRQDGVMVFKLSRVTADGQDRIEAKQVWRAETSKPSDENYASPLVHDGLFYRCSINGVLNVRNALTGENVYVEKLKLVRFNYPSLTLIGNNVMAADEQGHIIFFEKGNAFKEVAHIDFEPFRSCPVALGDRLYIRGLKHMYCIGTNR